MHQGLAGSSSRRQQQQRGAPQLQAARLQALCRLCMNA